MCLSLLIHALIPMLVLLNLVKEFAGLGTCSNYRADMQATVDFDTRKVDDGMP